MRTGYGFNRIRKIAAVAMCIVTALCACMGCGLIPNEEAEHKVKIMSQDVSEKYDLAMVDVGDVMLSKIVTCTYSQLNEIKLYFPISGYKVSSVYVHEGDPVSAGDLLATLDVSKLEDENLTLSQQIREDELAIEQANEMIAFYDSRISNSSIGLRDKEVYKLSRQEYEAAVATYEKAINHSRERIEHNEGIISQANLYSEVDGTVYYVKDDLQGSTPGEDTLVMKLLDSSACAFTANDKVASEYLEIGTPVTIVVANTTEYPATLVEKGEKGYMIFELDEPDYTISVGTRASIMHIVDTREQVLRLPRIAVYSTDSFSYVYTLSEDGIREMTPVEIGLAGDSYVEILGGIGMYTSVILR